MHSSSQTTRQNPPFNGGDRRTNASTPSSSAAASSSSSRLPQSPASSSSASLPSPASLSPSPHAKQVYAHVGLSQEAAMKIWATLRVAINEIHAGNASSLRFEELYRSAYSLVLNKQANLLYSGVQQTITQHLTKIRAQLERTPSELLISTIVPIYKRHVLNMTMMKDILMYLDKTFCVNAKVQPVFNMGLLLFRDQVVRVYEIHSRLFPSLLNTIARERDGERIDRSLLHTCLHMCVQVNGNSLELYEKDFESPFLAATKTFYAAEAQAFITENTVSDYLKKVEQRVREEEDRAENILVRSSRAKVKRVLQLELIQAYAKRLVNDEKTGATWMFNNNQIDDLRRMYWLFSQHGGPRFRMSTPKSTTATNHTQSAAADLSPVDSVRECMISLIRSLGVAAVSDKENIKNPTQFVVAVLAIRKQFSNIVEVSFKNDRAFVKALKESLEYFLNLDNRSAQYLTLYLDELMRRRLRTMTEAELDDELDSIISLFRYLQDKDVFEEFYKQQLAQRLLTTSAANLDMEKKFIGKLKAESGHQFTSRLEGMFKDIELSKQLQKSWEQSQEQQLLQKYGSARGGITNLLGKLSSRSEPAHVIPPPVSSILSVQVLTTGFWPLPSLTSVPLPSELQSVLEPFTAYYHSVHSGRRLTWQTHLGNAELRCVFASGKKELLVPTYQMFILMLFNRQDTYSFNELCSLTRIPEAELARHLLSLAHPNVHVLKKSPNTKLIAPGHQFTYNIHYTSKLYRNKIPLLSSAAVSGALPSLNESAKSLSVDDGNSNFIPPAVLEARKNGIEAAIVRIMKARKKLDHNALMSEVTKQISNRFPADATFIKRRIESLIEREYIERDQENRRLYTYLA